MTIDFNMNEKNLGVALDGRLDTITAPELESFLNTNLGTASALNIDCANLAYVSSAGLRVLLATEKKMKGKMKLTNVCEVVMEVFEMTGFADILVIE